MSEEIFISYSRKDRAKVSSLVSTLRSSGVSVWVDESAIDGATLWSQEIVGAIRKCKVFLLALSSNSSLSENVVKEVALASERGKKILPVMLEDTEVPESMAYPLAGIQRVNFFGDDEKIFTQSLERALKRTGLTLSSGDTSASQTIIPDSAGIKVSILYRRGQSDDESVLKLLEGRLKKEGMNVFIDRHMRIGVEWAQEISDQIRSSDAVVVLISETATTSEMIEYEIQIANEAAQERSGKPKILPVRIKYEGPLPQTLANILDKIQYTLWSGPEDDDRITEEIVNSLLRPQKPVEKVDKQNLLPAGGAVPLDSDFYVTRQTDGEFHQSLSRGDSIVLIKGARQMGKTSLLARGLQAARGEGATRVVFTDYQQLNSSHLESAENFFMALADAIADQLDLDVFPDEVWKPQRGPSINFERYLRKEVLNTIEGNLVWGMDESDRLFECDFSSEVFGLFRSWHNKRSLDPEGPWSRLTLVISYATEASLFITNVNQSPFNVGTHLTLNDFSSEQISQLNNQWGMPLKSKEEQDELYAMVGGQPFLIQRAFQEMVGKDLGLNDLIKNADRDDGIFGDHLRRLLVLLSANESAKSSVIKLIRGEGGLEAEAFFRLRAAGILSGESAGESRLRCKIYENYLKRHFQL